MVIFPDVDNIKQIAKNYKVPTPREFMFDLDSRRSRTC